MELLYWMQPVLMVVAIVCLVGITMNIVVDGGITIIKALALLLYRAPVRAVESLASWLEARAEARAIKPETVKAQSKGTAAAPAMSPSGKVVEEVQAQPVVEFMERKPDPLAEPAYMRKLGLEADHFLKVIDAQNKQLSPEQVQAAKRAKRDAVKAPMSARKQQLMSGIYSAKALSKVS